MILYINFKTNSFILAIIYSIYHIVYYKNIDRNIKKSLSILLIYNYYKINFTEILIFNFYIKSIFGLLWSGNLEFFNNSFFSWFSVLSFQTEFFMISFRVFSSSFLDMFWIFFYFRMNFSVKLLNCFNFGGN